MLLIIGWLPGALIFRAPVLDRGRRAELDFEERAFWAVLLSVAISLAAVLALAAMHRYSFSRLVMMDALVAAAAAAAWRGRLRMPEARRVTFTAVVPVIIIALGAWRFHPPAEYIMGGKDPGVYVNEGIQIAQRGALVVKDPVVAAVPPFARDLFLPRYLDLEGQPRTDYYSGRFMGFYIQDPATGAVVGQFPHLFPASIAIGYGIDGLTGARRATVVWGIFGLIAVYFAGRRVFGTAAAGAAAALLSFHVVQLWFARYPNAEVVMQALLFAAVLANARAHVDGLRFFAPVAGGLLGLLLFLRLDAILGIAAVVAAGGLGVFAGQAPRRSFWISLAVPSVLAAAYMAGPMRAYWHIYGIFLTNLAAWQYVGLAAAVAVFTFVIVAGARMPRIAAAVRRSAPTVLATAVAAAALYALFLRQPGGRLAAHDAYALRTFANLYFTVPGVLAAVLGFWLLARNRFWRDPALFLTIAVFSVSVFYKIRVVPEHFWMARRFLPVILPGALLLVCAAAFATTPSGRRWRFVRWAVGGTLVALLASTYLRVSRPLLLHTEYEGLIPKLEALAGRFGAEDLVILESRDAGGDVHVLATPLAYIYARNVLLLASPRPDKASMAAFVEWARANYDRVFFVGGGGTDLLSHSYDVRPVASERFEVPEFESTTDRLPRLVTRKDFEFGVYEFAGARPPDPEGWFDLDIGANDDLHVLRFHARELSDGRTFRWTRPTSYVAVTVVPAGARELTLILNDGGRPPAAAAARLEVYFHNQRLGEIGLRPGGFLPYTLGIPGELAARAASARDPVELRLVSTVWNPREVLGVADDRDLGVMVDRVTIK
ncbi:MAG TPA: hypothetical protein VJ813_05465 [Vicinamibacterales bacterium]|nr:hypothetical protein [Vicinamibacterales bacterium]